MGSARRSRLTILGPSCITKGYTRYVLLPVQVRQVAGNRIFKGTEIGGLGMQTDVAEPEVWRDQRANRGVGYVWTLIASIAQTDRVEAIQPVTNESHVLFYPQLVEPLFVPSVRGGGVVQEAATVLAVGVEDVDGGHGARGRVSDVCDAGHAVDDPYLLAGCRGEDAHTLRGVPYEQSERVPCPINAHPALIRRNRDGCGHRVNARQQLEVGRLGDVLLHIVGMAWQKQRGGEEGACGRGEGARAWQREHLR